jgi:transposase
MRRRHELTEVEWARLGPLLLPHQAGKRRHDDRPIINGILWKLAAGAPSDAPAGADRASARSGWWASLKLFRQRNDVWGIHQGFGNLARIAHENLLLLRTIGRAARLSEQVTCRRK